MCGIVGIFHKQRSQHKLEVELQSMLFSIRHRGYSKYEISSGPGWLFGANRLEIVGRDTGRQPKYSTDGSIAVVFNGEIYNYQELKNLLIARGYTFNSDTDTEVIANGYQHWGNDLFLLLDGMFAILIWDKNQNTFIAARDPLGVKPLYYAKSHNTAYFASEIKALIDTSNNVMEFPAGHYVVGSHKQVKYYHQKALSNTSSLKENAVQLRNLVRNAVKKRVNTDLPVAVFFSGGIDSSAILYEAYQLHPDVTAFSVGDSNSSDVLHAKRLCQHLSIPFVHISVSPDELLSLIPEVVWSIESFEPNHIRGGSLSYVLSREVAKRGYKIALCGEGADELFGGYREFGVALDSRATDDILSKLFNRFTSELHKTQLQRVDRTSMRFTLEVREPILDKHILEFAYSLPVKQKISFMPTGRYQNKIVLREAYRGLLPDWIVDREKVVLSLGAGYGSNGPEGIFYDHALKMMSEEEFEKLRNKYPDYSLKNREEAYYFTLFITRFGELDIAKARPLVNATAVSQ